MKKTDNRLVEWAINETRTHYSDDVSILLEHNTYCLEEDRGVRFVNTIISDSKKHIGLARTFIINGVGYDLNQVSWDSFERDAEVKGYYLTVLAEANILYSKNEAEKQRFLYLRAKLNANLANPQYMFERGLEWLNNATDVYKTQLFEETLSKARKGAGFIVDYLSMAVACYNQTYFKSFTRIDDLRLMKHLPERFIELYNLVVSAKSVSEMQTLCYDIIHSTRDFFKTNDTRKRETEGTSNYQYLAEWYQECSYYFKRIYHFCAQNDSALAFSGACGIQTDLDDLANDFGISSLDILTGFNADSLPAFATVVKKAEDCIVSAIETHNVKIEAYTSVDEFIKSNS